MSFQEIEKIRNEINTLFNQLDDVEKRKEKSKNLSQTEEYDVLSEKAAKLYENITIKIQDLRQRSSELAKYKEQDLLAVLQEMAKFIREYRDNSDELCKNLKYSHKEFTIKNSQFLKDIYQEIWDDCGLGELK
jgi:methyl-accepting chemotaxis protein